MCGSVGRCSIGCPSEQRRLLSERQLGKSCDVETYLEKSLEAKLLHDDSAIFTKFNLAFCCYNA